MWGEGQHREPLAVVQGRQGCELGPPPEFSVTNAALAGAAPLCVASCVPGELEPANMMIGRHRESCMIVLPFCSQSVRRFSEKRFDFRAQALACERVACTSILPEVFACKRSSSVSGVPATAIFMCSSAKQLRMISSIDLESLSKLVGRLPHGARRSTHIAQLRSGTFLAISYCSTTATWLGYCW